MTVLASSTLAFIVINSNFLIFIRSSPPAPSGVGIMIMPALKLDCLLLKQSFFSIHRHSTEAFQTQTLQITLNAKRKHQPDQLHFDCHQTREWPQVRTLLPTLPIPPSLKSGRWHCLCEPSPGQSLQRHFPGGQMDCRAGFFTQCRQEALMEEPWLSPCSHRWSCQEGLPFQKGPTLLSWHLWQHPLCLQLNFSAPRAETPPDLPPPVRP